MPTKSKGSHKYTDKERAHELVVSTAQRSEGSEEEEVRRGEEKKNEQEETREVLEKYKDAQECTVARNVADIKCIFWDGQQ